MTCEVGSRYTEQGNLLADCPGEASERGVSYDSTSRAELAAKAHAEAPTDLELEAEQGSMKSSRRGIKTVEKGSGNDSACGGASEPERSRDNIQNVRE